MHSADLPLGLVNRSARGVRRGISFGRLEKTTVWRALPIGAGGGPGIMAHPGCLC